jgi:prepilin-type N-terminal cleavage/methylation domain-containing protein
MSMVCARATVSTDEGRRARLGGERGFSLLEVLVVVGILGVLALISIPLAGKIIRRTQDLGGYSAIRQALASARLQAVKRQANVVVVVSVTTDSKRIRLLTFQDRANNAANPLPADEQAAAGNFQQDSGFLAGATHNEPTLSEIILPASVRLWKSGGTKDDLTNGVSFDKYGGNASLVDRIAFIPSGGIAPPEDTGNSALPTTSGGRGIYFADFFGKNYFRVTVDSDLSGHIRVDKLVEGTGYTPTKWVWR